MADTVRQQQVLPEASVPGQDQLPGQGPLQGPEPVPGPGVMPWGAPGPGGPLSPGMQQGGPESRVQQPSQDNRQPMPQTPQRRTGYIDPHWNPSGSTIHDRMMELVQRYMDSALQDARGIQGMMMRDGANRMYPRIEATIRGMSEGELRSEIAAIQSQMKKVLGEKEASAKQPAKKKRKTRRVQARNQVRR